MSELFDDVEYDQAAVDVRRIQLATSSTGVTYYLEPKHGHMRGIVARRSDGKSVPVPECLEGAFTDPRNAAAKVETYLNYRGKKTPAAIQVPVMDFTTTSLLGSNEPVREEPEMPADELAAAKQMELDAIAAELASEQMQLDEETPPPPPEKDPPKRVPKSKQA